MRKQKIKKILSLLAAGVLLLMSMSGCGKEAETGKTQVKPISLPSLPIAVKNAGSS